MRFAVTPEQLMGGAAAIDVGGPSDGTLPSPGLEAAAASTPVEPAWTAFFSQATGAAVSLDAVSADLAAGLRGAASNYTQTETRNAANLRGAG